MDTLTEIKVRVYKFGNKIADGNSEMKNHLVGKEGNLEEMSSIEYRSLQGLQLRQRFELGRENVIDTIKEEVEQAVESIESTMGTKFGDKENPLSISVLSGTRVSMSGMMDTVFKFRIE